MTQRYDVMTGRQYTDRNGDTKTAWTRIGTMFPNKSGDGFSITFDALPLPQMREGKLEVRAVCFPPKERDGAAPQGGAPKDYLSDEVPF